MNTNVRTWMEEKGTVRTVLRSLALWDYSSFEVCKAQLLQCIEKENAVKGPYLLQHAIDKRKNEVQWISAYLPLFTISVPVLFIMWGAMLSKIPGNLCLAFELAAAAAIFYRLTWFCQYLEARKSIYRAGDCLLSELIAKENLNLTADIEEGRLTAPTLEEEFVPALKMILPTEDVPAADEITDSILTCQAIEPPTIEQFGQEHAIPSAENEASGDLELEENPNKGRIKMILLNEMIKNECNRPNVFMGDLHKGVQYYAYIAGCKPKNILDKSKYYRNRESMNLSTSNSRTTHKKYIELLLEHYLEIGDESLYLKAENLQAYIESLNNRKK